MRSRLLEAFFVRASVGTTAPAGRFRYVRLHAPQFKDVAWIPGQQVRVDCGLVQAFAPVLRTYSVWAHEEDWIELYCLVHGDGPGSAWADQVAPGQIVHLSKPKGDFVIRPAAYHVFVGDESASAAFGPMMRALPPSQPAYAVVETADERDQLPLSGDVTWVRRTAEASGADPANLVDAVTHLSLPDEPGAAYLAGEARTIQAVRNVLVRERGWPRRDIHTKPFWTPGKRGME